jgi:uncharacterized protein
VAVFSCKDARTFLIAIFLTASPEKSRPLLFPVMPTTKMVLLRTLQLLLAGYVIICVAVYFFQERLIFFPEKLDAGHRFTFPQPFEEVSIPTGGNGILHGLWFRADSAKGLVFFLHGNAGSVDSWGGVAKTYTDLHYDVFMPDYPGYGKSTGAITGKAPLLAAVGAAYNEMKRRYSEDRIVIVGYSIGAGPAAYLASTQHPRLLLLQAPYYSMTDMMRHSYPILPPFLLKYTFQTNEYLRKCAMPVVLVHGDRDEVIYYGSSLKLKEELKPGDSLITLKGQGHNGMTENPDYQAALRTILP